MSKRIFMVGSPRSGTTLLQSMLGAHPSVVTLPETHFFSTLTNTPRWVRGLGLGSVSALEGLRRSFAAVNHEPLYPGVGLAYGYRRMADLSTQLLQELDHFADLHGASHWIEKTPRHLRSVKYIQRYIRDASFVHLLREGEEVISSVVRITRKYPREWSGARSVAECASRWSRDVELSRAYLGRPGHIHVRFEDLIVDPENVLRALCDALGLGYSPAMLDDQVQTAKSVTLGDPWNASTYSGIRTRAADAESALTEEEQLEMQNLIADVDVSWCRGVSWSGQPMEVKKLPPSAVQAPPV